MDIAHIHIKRRKHFHRLFDGVRNVVQFQIEKNFMSARFYVANYLRSFRVEQFHAYFDKRFSVREPIKKVKDFFSCCKITGYYYILTHDAPSL